MFQAIVLTILGLVLGTFGFVLFLGAEQRFLGVWELFVFLAAAIPGGLITLFTWGMLCYEFRDLEAVPDGLVALLGALFCGWFCVKLLGAAKSEAVEGSAA